MMALSIETKEDNDEKSSMSRLRPESPQNPLSLSPGAGRSPSHYEEHNNHLLPPRTTFGNQSDYHIASFTKPIQPTAYGQVSAGIYMIPPPPARSPPACLPPPQPPLLPNMSLLPGPSIPLSPSLDAQSSSFTNTFLRGILSSIDSKDPVVANAWLETLLDAIDLLPPDVIKREIVMIAVNKAQIEQTNNSRKAACRLLGKIACKLDPQTVRQEILPAALALCQDSECEVRHCMCCHLGFVAHGLGPEVIEATIIPQLVDLGNDENCEVRLAAVEAVVHLLGLLDNDTCTHTIVPLVIKSCERAKRLQDDTLPKFSHYLGRLCHGLMPNLNSDQKSWFVNFFRHLAQLGLPPSRDSSLKKGKMNDPMPDLLPSMETDRSELHTECRLQCAFNFPAMVVFVEPSNFVDMLYPAFLDLASDPAWRVRQTLARGLHEVAKLVGIGFNITKMEICSLFADPQIEVLEAMVSNMVHVIDALARHGVLQFAGQGGKYSHDLSRSLLKCEETISQTRNWRLQADCLEKFSCLANCISPVTIMQKFIPLLFTRIQFTRTLPCRVAAARTLLVILRFTVKVEDRSRVICRIQQDLANGKSCHTRMLFLRLCEMAMSLFSKQYFKRNFFDSMIFLAKDSVPNIRLKLCSGLPRLKSLLSLPSDRSLLQRLEDTIKDLLLRESDTDVLFAVQKAIQDLDGVETGVDGVPSMNADEDRENERKLREERLIASMEEQLYKSSNSDIGASSSPTKNLLPVSGGERLRYLTPSPPASSSTSPLAEPSRRRSESLPPPLLRGSNYDSFSNLARQTPEPLRTYQTEVSDYTTAAAEREYASKNYWTPRDFSQQPYSSSLENLDPSAQEFLVDAGIILDKSSILNAVSSSMPNLNKVNMFLTGQSGSSASADDSTDGKTKKGILEGEFSKYLISNEEMEQYEAEYQRCANAIASGDPATLMSGNSASLSRPKQDVNNVSPTRHPTTSSSSSSSVLPQASDKLLSISSLAQNTFTKLASSDTLQGSIERLAEKWEAKRKSLTDDSTDGLELGASNNRQQRSAAVIEQNKLIALKQQAIPKRRSLLKPPTGPSATASHNKIGQLGTQRVLTARKRLSLTDHVGAVSQQAMQKLINRKSLNSNDMMIGYNDGDDKNGMEDSDDSRRMNKMKGMRRFASMDDNKNDDNYLDGETSYNGTSSYITKASKPIGMKPRAESSYYYNSSGSNMSHAHSQGGSSRTLPQPPRSLPMTPGSNSGHQKMMFIPSKPFNNFLSQPSPLSSSAPANMPVSGSRNPYIGSSPTTPPTSSSRQTITRQSSGISPARRGGPDAVPKTKIVSPYIVSVDTSQESDHGFGSLTPSESPTTPDHNPANESQAPKFSRLPPPRYRPQPSTAPPQRRPASATTRTGAKVTTSIQNGLKQQYGKSLSAESINSIDQFENEVSYGMQPTTNHYGSSSNSSYSSGRRNQDEFSRKSSEPESKPQSNSIRRSSGARMWQGQMSSSNVRQRSQEGRSPSNQSSGSSSLPPSSAGRGRTTRATTGQEQYDSHTPVHPRTSYGSGPNQSSYQSKMTGLRSRPSSIHSSPGSSRPSSPQTVNHPTNKSHLQQQPQTQQRRPLATKSNPSSASQGQQLGGSSFSSRTPPSVTSQTNQRSSISSNQFGTRRQNSQTSPASSAAHSSSPNYSTSTSTSTSASSRNNQSYSRQQSQGGLPTPGFTSRLASQRQAK